MLPAEQNRPDIARKRRRWKAHQHRVDPRRLVFLDETWVKTNMAPLRGWGPKGKRLAASVPYGHWMTMTFIAALRCNRVEAPCVIDGPINGSLFTAYIEQFLAPTLARGDIVISDRYLLANVVYHGHAGGLAPDEMSGSTFSSDSAGRFSLAA